MYFADAYRSAPFELTRRPPGNAVLNFIVGTMGLL